MCRERARVRRLNDEMARIRDKAALLPCGTSPKDKGERTLTRTEQPNDVVGEPLPAMPRVGRRGMSAYGQHRVEEQHALPCPRDKAAVCGRRDTEIVLHFLVDVEEGRRRLDANLHGERKPVCLPVTVVRVLPENDDLRIRKARVVQRVENRKHIGIDALRAVLLDEKLP